MNGIKKSLNDLLLRIDVFDRSSQQGLKCPDFLVHEAIV